MRALDIEDNLEHLRYDKIILATDANVDALHIRNLLIIYSCKFFESSSRSCTVHLRSVRIV